MAFGDKRGTLQVTAKSITNPFTATGSVASVAVGDLIFAVLTQENAITATDGGTSDNLGNSYTVLATGTNTITKAWYAIVTAGHTGTLTGVSATTTASGNNATFAVDVVVGPFSTIDKNPAGVETGSPTSPQSCPASGVLAQTSEVVMGYAGAGNTGAFTSAAASAPMTLDISVADPGPNTGTLILRTVVSSTSSVTPAFTFSNSPDSADKGTASFKAQVVAQSPFGNTRLGDAPKVYRGQPEWWWLPYNDLPSIYANSPIGATRLGDAPKVYRGNADWWWLPYNDLPSIYAQPPPYPYNVTWQWNSAPPPRHPPEFAQQNILPTLLSAPVVTLPPGYAGSFYRHPPTPPHAPDPLPTNNIGNGLWTALNPPVGYDQSFYRHPPTPRHGAVFDLPQGLPNVTLSLAPVGETRLGDAPKVAKGNPEWQPSNNLANGLWTALNPPVGYAQSFYRHPPTPRHGAVFDLPQGLPTLSLALAPVGKTQLGDAPKLAVGRPDSPQQNLQNTLLVPAVVTLPPGATRLGDAPRSLPHVIDLIFPNLTATTLTPPPAVGDTRVVRGAILTRAPTAPPHPETPQQNLLNTLLAPTVAVTLPPGYAQSFYRHPPKPPQAPDPLFPNLALNAPPAAQPQFTVKFWRHPPRPPPPPLSAIPNNLASGLWTTLNRPVGYAQTFDPHAPPPRHGAVFDLPQGLPTLALALVPVGATRLGDAPKVYRGNADWWWLPYNDLPFVYAQQPVGKIQLGDAPRPGSGRPDFPWQNLQNTVLTPLVTVRLAGTVTQLGDAPKVNRGNPDWWWQPYNYLPYTYAQKPIGDTQLGDAPLLRRGRPDLPWFPVSPALTAPTQQMPARALFSGAPPAGRYLGNSADPMAQNLLLNILAPPAAGEPPANMFIWHHRGRRGRA